MFRTPRRRDTRQRSGFTVSGEKTGSEALVVRALPLNVKSSKVTLHFLNTECSLPTQFEADFGMGAVGGYFKTQFDCKLELRLEVIDPIDETVIVAAEKERSTKAGVWIRFGVDVQVEEAVAYDVVTLRASVSLENPTGKQLGVVQLFGVNLDTVTAYSVRDVKEDYDKKTSLYYPEIYYLEHDEPFIVDPVAVEGEVAETEVSGEQLILKACNRCARFLPIDINNERYAMGFSNHCVQRAPCEHRAFSRFRVENWGDVKTLDEDIKSHVTQDEEGAIVEVHYGFQLECRPCKKFTVNAPLNPLRNAAQRREDSLRRRAVEQIVMRLLERDWIFYTYRQEEKKEFDTHIWEKFGKQCFACGKQLPTVRDMDLDHTMPLVYLWPLGETATCLCSSCNAQKHDLFPFEFLPYLQPGKLEELADLTGLDLELIAEPVKRANPEAVARLRQEIEWFFDEFLAEKQYQKDRHGKKTADLILASIQRILDETKADLNLVEEYVERTGNYPETVTVDDE